MDTKLIKKKRTRKEMGSSLKFNEKKKKKIIKTQSNKFEINCKSKQ